MTEVIPGGRSVISSKASEFSRITVFNCSGTSDVLSLKPRMGFSCGVFVWTLDKRLRARYKVSARRSALRTWLHGPGWHRGPFILA